VLDWNLCGRRFVSDLLRLVPPAVRVLPEQPLRLKPPTAPARPNGHGECKVFVIACKKKSEITVLKGVLLNQRK
jgi:hypothetical protein